MTLLILGLATFLGIHSTRIFAEGFRNAQVARLGLNGWKAVYSVVSIAGFVLIVYGYGEARLTPVAVWSPPLWTRHLAALLAVPACWQRRTCRVRESSGRSVIRWSRA